MEQLQLYINGRLTIYGKLKPEQISFFKRQFTPEGINYLATRPNIIHVKKLYFSWSCKFQRFALRELQNGNWQNLKFLTINGGWPRINLNARCTQLKNMKAPTLTDIKFHDNYIGPEGAFVLTEADWPKVLKIDFENNRIGDDGCHYLSRSKWKLTSVRLVKNQIGYQGVRSLLSSNWQNLTKLQLSKNDSIGDMGCKYLCQAQWEHLISLFIQNIGITKAGCKWLSKAKWKLLNKFRFGSDFINWEGFEYLCCSDLPKLTDVMIERLQTIRDRKNEDERWFCLLKSNWKLKHFSMRSHRFENPVQIQQIYQRFCPSVVFFK